MQPIRPTLLSPRLTMARCALLFAWIGPVAAPQGLWDGVSARILAPDVAADLMRPRGLLRLADCNQADFHVHLSERRGSEGNDENDEDERLGNGLPTGGGRGWRGTGGLLAV